MRTQRKYVYIAVPLEKYGDETKWNNTQARESRKGLLCVFKAVLL